MFGSRQFVISASQFLGSATLYSNDGDPPPTPPQFVTRLLKQSKQLSQIVAYIWLHADDDPTSEHGERARKLDEYFKDNERLERLLTTIDSHSEPGNLLVPLPMINELPLFNVEENFFYKFVIDVNRFDGCLTDPAPGTVPGGGPNSANLMTFVIPYPPRPEISSTAAAPPITTQQLQDWIAQDPSRPPYFNMETPYVPTSCS